VKKEGKRRKGDLVRRAPDVSNLHLRLIETDLIEFTILNRFQKHWLTLQSKIIASANIFT